MPECFRCGRAEEDGATLQETADGPLCMVCVDYLQEHPGRSRELGQAGLEDYD